MFCELRALFLFFGTVASFSVLWGRALMLEDPSSPFSLGGCRCCAMAVCALSSWVQASYGKSSKNTLALKEGVFFAGLGTWPPVCPKSRSSVFPLDKGHPGACSLTFQLFPQSSCVFSAGTSCGLAVVKARSSRDTALHDSHSLLGLQRRAPTWLHHGSCPWAGKELTSLLTSVGNTHENS